ncbi:MFS transporter [Microbacteriaceae bacterium VKM Ac-2854]|nr:MFS transporter [Microbacteriaceae bacterium VKM Ac-2854]
MSTHHLARRTQAVAVGAAFSVLLAGTNAINPLLPVYRESLGIDPLLVSLTFVSYVSVLVITLLVFSRPGMARFSPISVSLALAIAILADGLLWSGTEWGILTGRAVAGVSGGIGTGAASALVVAAVGARGRSISATGNLIGAVIGTAFSQASIAVLGERAIHDVFVWHAAACAVVMVVVVATLVIRRDENRDALRAKPMLRAAAEAAPETSRRRAVPLITGIIGWIAVSGALVFLPSFFDDLGEPSVRASGIIILLGCSAAGQLASPRLVTVAGSISGLPALALGVVLIFAGGAISVPALSLLGFALIGFGIGVSYRIGLVVFTRGSNPARQGSLAAIYAAATYAAAALLVLSVGGLGNLVGLMTATIILFSAVCVAAVVCIPFAPRLRDTLEPTAPLPSAAPIDLVGITAARRPTRKTSARDQPLR